MMKKEFKLITALSLGLLGVIILACAMVIIYHCMVAMQARDPLSLVLDYNTGKWVICLIIIGLIAMLSIPRVWDTYQTNDLLKKGVPVSDRNPYETL